MKFIVLCAFSLLFFCGCNSIETYNYQISETVKRSIIQEGKKTKELNQKALFVVFTGGKEKLRFLIKRGNSPPYQHCEGKIDHDSFSAICIPPGKYIWQRGEILDIKPNQIFLWETTSKRCSPISMEQFEKKISNKYLSKEVSITDPKIISAHKYFSCKVSNAEVFGRNAGLCIGHTIASPFYVVYGTFVCLNYVARLAMKTSSPGAIIIGGVIYFLTFWAVPPPGNEKVQDAFVATIDVNRKNHFQINTTSQNITPNTFRSGVNSNQYGQAVKWQVIGQPNANTQFLDVKQDVNRKNHFQINTTSQNITPNTYGPGVNSNRYGQAVKWQVIGQPNANTQFLDVKQNAYGPGVGMDQFGRPVRSVSAWGR